MKRYSVSIPITGFAVVEVTAESEKDAIEIALETPFELDAIEEWDAHDVVAEGNVCYATLNRVMAEEIGEADE